MPARLIIEEGELRGLMFPLEGDAEWVLGRDPEECDFVVEDLAISRKHVLCYKRKDRFILKNLNENNPIYLNGERAATESELHDGDTLQMGNHSFLFYEDKTLSVLPSENSSVNSMGAAPFTQAKAFMTQVRQDTIFDIDDDALDYLDLELLDPGRWTLKVVAGPLQGAEFALEEEKSYVIGNDPRSCDIVLHDRTVSRRHAQIRFTVEQGVILEDLGSRNGTTIEGKTIEEPLVLAAQTYFSLGTTTLLLIDREAPTETLLAVAPPPAQEEKSPEPFVEPESVGEETVQEEVVSKPAVEPEPAPLVEQKEEESVEPTLAAKEEVLEEPVFSNTADTETEQQQKTSLWQRYRRLLIIGVVGFLAIGVITLTVRSLFETEEVEDSATRTIEQQIADIMQLYPSVSYQFQKEGMKLRLWEHVLTEMDYNQLMSDISAVSAIKNLESQVIIDELVWKEMNAILARNDNWKGISMTARLPKQFILVGYLRQRQQAEELLNYLKLNFDYIDLLDNQVIVEEELMNMVISLLQENKVNEVIPEFIDGEIIFSGFILPKEKPILEQIIQQVKKTQGLRGVKNSVLESAGRGDNAVLIDLTGQYPISGYFRTNHAGISVVISGRIYAQGDRLEDYYISAIEDNTVILEKNGVKYKIEFK